MASVLGIPTGAHVTHWIPGVEQLQDPAIWLSPLMGSGEWRVASCEWRAARTVESGSNSGERLEQWRAARTVASGSNSGERLEQWRAARTVASGELRVARDG